MKKILIVTLMLMVLPLTANVNAQETNTTVLTNNLFGSVQTFFNSVGSDASMQNGQAVPNKEHNKKGADGGNAASSVKNTANACDGKRNSSCDSASDFADLTGLSGITIDKSMVGTGTNDGKSADTPAEPGDSVEMTLTVKNTGNSAKDITVQDGLTDSGISYNGSEAITVQDSSGSDASVTPKNPTINDIVNGKLVINGAGAGSEYTIVFDAQIAADATDYETETANFAEACMPFDQSDASDPYSYVNTNDDGLKDGVVYDDGTGNATLCSDAADSVYISPGGTPVNPGAPDVISQKSVSDDDGDKIAEGGDTLTYTISVRNVAKADTKVNIQDDLNETSVAKNVTFDDEENLISSDGTSLTDDSDTALTIADLKAGFDYTIPQGGTVKFTFTGKVNDPIDQFSLDNKRITNTASICKSTECDTPSASISATSLEGVDIQKDVDITDLDADGDGDLDPDDQAVTGTLTYTITVSNKTAVDKSNVVVKDNLPTSYVTADQSQSVTVTPTNADTNPTPVTVGDLASGVTINTLPANSNITFVFPITVNDSVYTDPLTTGSVITNTASACTDLNGESVCDTDSAETTMDDTYPVQNDFSVQKSVTDGDASGIADPGEDLNYSLVVSNNSDSNMIINLKDPLSDQSYDVSGSEKLSVDSNGTFVDNSGKALTGDATTSDLQNGAVNVNVLPNSSATVTFTVKASTDQKTDNSIDDADTITNTVTACSDLDYSGDIKSPDECTDSGASIDLQGKQSLDIKKTVEDTGQTKDLNYTATQNDIAEPSEILSYTITVDNTGNQPIDYTLTDNLIDANFDFDATDFTQVLTISPATDLVSPTGATLADLDTNSGGSGLTMHIDSGATTTVTFSVVTSANSDTGEVNYPGNNIVNTSEATYTDQEGVSQVKDSDVAITTDTPINPDGTVLKTATDEDADGVADRGDKVTFHVKVANPTDTDMTYQVIEKDPIDPNIDYTIADPLTVDTDATTSTDAKFVDSDGEAKDYTEADLFTSTDGTTADGINTDGIYVFVPAGQSLTFTFDGTVKANFKVPETVLTNSIQSCYESEADSGTYDLCNNSTASIPTEGFEDFEISKEVTSATQSDGTTPTGTGTEADPFYAVDGGKITYNLTLNNTGSVGMDSVTMTDNVQDSYYTLSDGDIIDAYETDANGDKVTDGITTDDVTITPSSDGDGSFNLSYDGTLAAGHSLVIVYQGTLKSNIGDYINETDETQVPNVMEGCYQSDTGLNVDGKTGTICKDIGVEVPYGKDNPNADDPAFSVQKDLTDGNGDGVIDPGEDVNFVITVINNDPDHTGKDQTLLVTDEMFDKNLDYEAHLTDSVTINGDGVKVELPDGTTDASAAKIENLLPDATDSSAWNNQDAYTRYTDGSSDPDAAQTGGIEVTVPANGKVTFSFNVTAKGSLSAQNRIEQMFNFKKYFGK